WSKFCFHILSVCSTHPKNHDSSDVSKNSIPHFGVFILLQLSNILVTNNHTEAIFASFRQNSRKAFGGKVLELVYVQVKIFTNSFGNIRTGHSGELQFSDNH